MEQENIIEDTFKISTDMSVKTAASTNIIVSYGNKFISNYDADLAIVQDIPTFSLVDPSTGKKDLLRRKEK